MAGKTTELPKQYSPHDHEARIWSRWEGSGAFHADPAKVLDGSHRPYCILMPPPNVTDRLHLGHALNGTLQDILIRAHRMMGYETLWMPGTDHAGIATQTVVEKRLLREEGKSRKDYEREEFVAKVQTFKDGYEATITDQFKRLGASADWVRQRFTMDEQCARAVREGFFRLFKEGLIYRGKRLVNWDPVTQTALADDEVEMHEVEGKFYYLRYPLYHPWDHDDEPTPVTWSELQARGYPSHELGGDADEHPEDEPAWVTVATTRPETYLGDSGVAVNPKDPRASALRDLCVVLPLVGRAIPIVEDDYVEPPVRFGGEKGNPKAEMATGFLKVTPAHDPNDWEIGQRHHLKVINVMAPDASISDQHGWDDVGDAHIFVGLSREDARKKVVDEFHARGLLERAKPYTHSVGHSYRSHAPIEPYLSDQWYVRVTDDRLRGEALRAMAPEQREGEAPKREYVSDSADYDETDDQIRFYPARYARMFQTWHENLRDWCISRQLWWGHRIPVWSREQSTTSDARAFADERGFAFASGSGLEFICVPPFDDSETDESAAAELAAQGFEQDPDVLDTWFSSGVWPISTMGWPEEASELLNVFNPSSVLCTAREIITLWVSRMVMFNRFFRDSELPFKDVFIHALVMDGEGQKMSKSLGNGVDPLDIIHSHGADALRLTICHMTTQTQDVRMPLDLVCPHCEHVFTPKTVVTKANHTVAAPTQDCPRCDKSMVSLYGAFSGEAAPSPEEPQARNTSSRFDAGRNFCNKLWNAGRLTLMLLESGEAAPRIEPSELPLVDRWMLSRLARVTQAVTEDLRGYQYSQYAQNLYDLLWRDFCDWYLEAIKPTAKDESAEGSRQRAVLRATFEAILRLLHPVIPFVSETIYEQLAGGTIPDVPGLRLERSPNDLLISSPWPRADDALIDETAEGRFEALRALVEEIRQIRAKQSVPPKRRITLHASKEAAEAIARGGTLVETLATLERVTTDAPSGPAVAFTHEKVDYQLSGLADAVDLGAERERLKKDHAQLTKSVSALRGRLNNKSYIEKAPAHLVEQTRDQLQKAESDLEIVAKQLESLG